MSNVNVPANTDYRESILAARREAEEQLAEQNREVQAHEEFQEALGFARRASQLEMADAIEQRDRVHWALFGEHPQRELPTDQTQQLEAPEDTTSPEEPTAEINDEDEDDENNFRTGLALVAAIVVGLIAWWFASMLTGAIPGAFEADSTIATIAEIIAFIATLGLALVAGGLTFQYIDNYAPQGGDA